MAAVGQKRSLRLGDSTSDSCSTCLRGCCAEPTTENWLDPGFASWSLTKVLPRVQCPVLSIHGADDEYGSLEHPNRIAKLVSGPAQLVLMANTGHVPHRQHQEEVLRHIAELLSGA